MLLDSRLRGNDGVVKRQSFYESIKLDDLVKSHFIRHPRAGGDPSFVDINGFPLARE